MATTICARIYARGEVSFAKFLLVAHLDVPIPIPNTPFFFPDEFHSYPAFC
jgi:hypothetical protein